MSTNKCTCCPWKFGGGLNLGGALGGAAGLEGAALGLAGAAAGAGDCPRLPAPMVKQDNDFLSQSPHSPLMTSPSEST